MTVESFDSFSTSPSLDSSFDQASRPSSSRASTTTTTTTHNKTTNHHLDLCTSPSSTGDFVRTPLDTLLQFSNFTDIIMSGMGMDESASGGNGSSTKMDDLVLPLSAYHPSSQLEKHTDHSMPSFHIDSHLQSSNALSAEPESFYMPPGLANPGNFGTGSSGTGSSSSNDQYSTTEAGISAYPKFDRIDGIWNLDPSLSSSMSIDPTRSASIPSVSEGLYDRGALSGGQVVSSQQLSGISGSGSGVGISFGRSSLDDPFGSLNRSSSASSAISPAQADLLGVGQSSVDSSSRRTSISPLHPSQVPLNSLSPQTIFQNSNKSNQHPRLQSDPLATQIANAATTTSSSTPFSFDTLSPSLGASGSAIDNRLSSSFDDPLSLHDPSPGSVGYPASLFGAVPLPKMETSWSGRMPASNQSLSDTFSGTQYAQALAVYEQMLSALSHVQPLPSQNSRPSSSGTYDSILQLSEKGVDILSGTSPLSSSLPSASASSSRHQQHHPRHDRTSPKPTQSSHSKTKSPTKADASSSRRRSSSDKSPTRCLGCGTSSCPQWRRGPLGPRTLCNACGLVHMKLQRKKRKLAEKSAAAGQDASDDK